ncbi:MAG TPA: alanine racemase [Coriobacteriia bacterium]|nr:alanine racemase [Coriobacteriia bacterium]
MTQARWAWAEIDLSAIRHNVRVLSALTGPSTAFMAVVKADGYGHGAVEVARAALSAGATHLGVATVAEGVALREAGLSAPLHVLSEPPETSIATVLEHGLVPTLYTHEFAAALGHAAALRGAIAPFHLKVDTGMNRIGVRAEDAPRFAAGLAGIPAIRLEGTFTHFATADVPGDWDVSRQLERFSDALAAMRTEGVEPGLVHAANSPATILYPESHFGMVRCGIALYGLQPSHHTRGRVDLRPAMSVKARATLVKRVPMGEGVSYGLTWQAASAATIATLPLGYADGVHRVLSNTMEVLVGGRRAKQVGRVCMDQFMVELPRAVEARRGDEFVLVGEQGPERISMEELADLAGTINYELACSFGMRLPRVYR